MNRLLCVAAALCLSLGALPTHAQNAVTGRALFEDTINATGINTFTGNCTSCHGSVQDRRTKIGGSPFAEISLTLATNRVGLAIASQSAMQQFQVLSPAQIEDIAAYIADTPEVSTDQLDFTASAVNTMTAAQFVELRNSKAAPASESLKVVKVEITGTGAARFRRTADTCDQATVAVAGTCRVTLDFTAPDTTPTIVPLVLTLRQGTSATTFSRTVLLNGAVAVSSAPGGGASAADSGGGGALGWPWLVGLGAATASLLALRVRSDRPVLIDRRKRAERRRRGRSMERRHGRPHAPRELHGPARGPTDQP
jgi:mono/diheme cytochrome c family protein